MKLSSANVSLFSKNNKRGIWGDVLVLFLLSFLFRYLALQQTNYANGWDAYFYLIQIKSWIEEGAMHSSDSSLVYPLMRLIHWFSGDYVLSFKLMSALLASSFVVLVYFFGKKITTYGTTILLAFYLLWSPHLTWFAAQYPKNLLGLNLMILFFLSCKSRYWWLPVIILLINYFGHRMTFILSAIYFLIFVFEKVISRNQFLKNIFSNWKKWGIGVFAILISLMVINYFSSGLLHITDLERFDGMITMQPHFAPFTFFNEYNEGKRLSVFWKMEIGLSVLFCFVGVLFLLLRKEQSIRSTDCFTEDSPHKRRRWLGESKTIFILCSILIFPFLKWSLTSMSFRFVLVFILLSPLFLATVFSIKDSRGWAVVGVLLLIGSFFSWKSYQPELHDAPYAKYDRVTKSTFDFIKNKNPDLVIAHNALAEYFTFTTGVDALPWQPEYETPEGKLWRIAADVRYPLFRTYLEEEDFKSIQRIGVRYYLMKESVWQKFKNSLLENNELGILEQINTWRNPYKVRPSYLTQSK